jgi:hypothetical protein
VVSKLNTDQLDGEHTVGRSTLRRIVEAWPRRAAVAKRPDAVDTVGSYDAELPDYPLDIVPFAQHPRFLAATCKQLDVKG